MSTTLSGKDSINFAHFLFDIRMTYDARYGLATMLFDSFNKRPSVAGIVNNFGTWMFGKHLFD